MLALSLWMRTADMQRVYSDNDFVEKTEGLIHVSQTGVLSGYMKLLILSDRQNTSFVYSEFQMIILYLLSNQDSGKGFVCTDLFQPVPQSRTFG